MARGEEIRDEPRDQRQKERAEGRKKKLVGSEERSYCKSIPAGYSEIVGDLLLWELGLHHCRSNRKRKRGENREAVEEKIPEQDTREEGEVDRKEGRG